MADIHYFVSSQNGNDANDGLSASTAWKTLTRATSVTADSGGTGTFGNSTVTAADSSGASTNGKVVQKTTLADTRTVTKVSFSLDTGPGTVTARAIIYNDNAGSPGQLVATSNEVTGQFDQVFSDFTFASPVTLSPGDYWWGLHVGSGLTFIGGEYGTSTTTYVDANDTYSDGTATTFASSPTTREILGIYATYTLPPRDTYIHVGPGEYREKVVLQNAGSGKPGRIIWTGDSECLWLSNDHPGKVVLSGKDANGDLTSGAVWNGSGKTYVECIGFECDGSLDNYAFLAGTGSPNVRFINCTVAGGYSGFSSGGCSGCIAQNCSGLGFFPTSSGTRNCIAVNCGTGFYGGGQVFRCLAAGCGTGFTGSVCYNECVASGCERGFETVHGYAYFCCLAVRCSTGFAGSNIYLYDCYEAGCATAGSGNFGPPTSLTDWGFPAGMGDWLPSVLDVPPAARGKGYWPVSRSTWATGGPRLLDVPYTLVLTNSEITAGSKSHGVGVVFTAVASVGTVTAEFQENVSGTWTTRAVVTKDVSQVTLNQLTIFEWPTPQPITSTASTWAVKFTAAGGAEAPGTTGLQGVTPAYWHFVDRPDLTDINGIRLPSSAAQDLGPTILSEASVDWDTYKTTAPGIKITGYGYEAFKVPAAAGRPLTKKFWVSHADTGAQSIFADEFDRADGPIGNEWTTVDAAWTIVGGEAQSAWGFSPLYRNDMVADGYWEADMYLPTPADQFADNKLGIWVRRDPAGNQYDYLNNGYTLFLRGAGTLVFYAPGLESVWSYTLPSGSATSQDRSVKVGLHVHGNVFDFYANGAKVGTWTETNPSARTDGTYGLIGWEIENARVKHFHLQTAPGGPMTASAKPQLILRGLGITEQVSTAVGSGGWEELSVSATPAVDGVMELVILARDSAPTAYSVFSDPS
ncbi:MAG: hypothetical protein ACM3UP_00650 [Methanocella sp.]